MSDRAILKGANEKQEQPVTPDEVKLFSEFFLDKRVMVCDENSSARSAVAKCLVDLGIKSNQLVMVSTFTEARNEIKSNPPYLIVCDYNIENRCGLELFPIQKQALPDSNQTLFILVTRNSTESAVAESAEEDVDSFILKPFTSDVFRNRVVRAAVNKKKPTAYKAKINEAKVAANANNNAKAIELLKEATKLDPKPALACYYMGQSYEKLSEIDKAEFRYEEGVQFNALHYKCAVSLFDVYVKTNKPQQAYDTMRKLSKYFPISPMRLSKVIELAVKTGHFTDVLNYYETYKNLEERREDVKKHVCAALIVAAMYAFRQKNVEMGIDLVQKAAITAAGNVSSLRDAAIVLCMYGQAETASKEILKRFPPEAFTKTPYLASEFLVGSYTRPTDENVNLGRKLIREGNEDPVIYRVLIKKLTEIQKLDEAQEMFEKACLKYPLEKAEFEKALSGQ